VLLYNGSQLNLVLSRTWSSSIIKEQRPKNLRKKGRKEENAEEWRRGGRKLKKIETETRKKYRERSSDDCQATDRLHSQSVCVGNGNPL